MNFLRPLAFSLILATQSLLFSIGAHAAIGEGTGHQRVIDIVGYQVPTNKIHLNEDRLPLQTKSLPMDKVGLIVLHSEEVFKMGQVVKMNFKTLPSNFGNLKSLLIKERGEVDKEDILAIITK